MEFLAKTYFSKFSFPFSGNWPLLKEGSRGRGEIRGNVAEGAQCIKYKPEGKVWGGSQEGDQEAPEASRSDQDLDRVCWNQGQVSAHGQAEAHWNGKTLGSML